MDWSETVRKALVLQGSRSNITFDELTALISSDGKRLEDLDGKDLDDLFGL